MKILMGRPWREEDEAKTYFRMKEFGKPLETQQLRWPHSTQDGSALAGHGRRANPTVSQRPCYSLLEHTQL
jgi:hypothetical protein